jgi:hypothetical protein
MQAKYRRLGDLDLLHDDDFGRLVALGLARRLDDNRYAP